MSVAELNDCVSIAAGGSLDVMWVKPDIVFMFGWSAGKQDNPVDGIDHNGVHMYIAEKPFERLNGTS